MYQLLNIEQFKQFLNLCIEVHSIVRFSLTDQLIIESLDTWSSTGLKIHLPIHPTNEMKNLKTTVKLNDLKPINKLQEFTFEFNNNEDFIIYDHNKQELLRFIFQFDYGKHYIDWLYLSEPVKVSMILFPEVCIWLRNLCVFETLVHVTLNKTGLLTMMVKNEFGKQELKKQLNGLLLNDNFDANLTFKFSRLLVLLEPIVSKECTLHFYTNEQIFAISVDNIIIYFRHEDSID